MLFTVLVINAIIISYAFVLPYSETLNEQVKYISVRKTCVLKQGYCYNNFHVLTLGVIPANCVLNHNI
jgi:hypothetical protein